MVRSRSTRSPATSRRNMPCQATATIAPRPVTAAHSSPTSPATGTSDQAAADFQAGGRAAGETGTPGAMTVWTRPCGPSTLWKIGPSAKGTRRMSTPASASASSSCAPLASGSTPTTAAVRRPSRAVVSAA